MISITNHRATGYLCVCMLALAVAGCGTTSTNSSGEWQQPRTREVPFQTVLVVAITPDSDARRAFEQTLAEAITDGGAKGIASYALGRQMGTSKLSRDLVVAMAEKSGADAVLVTRILQRSGQFGKSRDETYVHAGRTVTVVQNEDASLTGIMVSNYAVEVV